MLAWILLHNTPKIAIQMTSFAQMKVMHQKPAIKIEKKDKRMRRQKLTVTMILWFMLWATVSCNDQSEEKAQAIYDNAMNLRQQGRVMDALKEFDRLIEYKETSVYAKANDMLLKEGISIGASFDSWTIKQLENIQRKINRKGMDSHPDGNVIVPISTKDAWGTNIRIRYSTDSKFTYFVMSAGADQKFDTNDDLQLYQRRKKPVSALAPSSPKQTNAVPSSKSKTGESQVNLNDLVKGKQG